MSKLLTGFAESVRRLVRGSEATIVPAWQSRVGEKPVVSFEAQVSVYLGDTMARSAVDFLAEQITGPGFYTTAEEPKAKVVVDDFCASVNLDELLLSTAREVVAYGNSFWERITPVRLENLKLLPITSIERVERTAEGVVQGYRQTQAYEGGLLRSGQVIHWRWNAVNAEALGSGLIRSLCEGLQTSTGEVRPAVADMKARMEKAMLDQFEKFSGPTELWTFKGLTKDDLQAYANVLKRIPSKGARLAYNDEAEIKQAVVPMSRGWESHIEAITNGFLLGLETPIPRLFTTPGFTEASARAALEAAERKVMSLQRFIKRTIEREVFNPVVEQAGYNPSEAKVKLNWGIPSEPELVTSDVLKAFELGVLSRDEVRKILIGVGWKLMESQSLREWYFRDEQGRLRFVPETPEDRAEHLGRAKSVKQHLKRFVGIDDKERSKLERELMGYRAEDLEDVKISGVPRAIMSRSFGERVIGHYNRRTREIVVASEKASDAIHHEMGHHLAHKKFGTPDPQKYRKYLSGEYRKIIEEELGSYALEDEGEVFASGFSLMRMNPREVRKLVRKRLEWKEFFNEIMNDTNYRIGKVGK